MTQWPESFENAVLVFVGSLNAKDRSFLLEKHNLVSWDVGDHINFIVQKFGLAQHANMKLLSDIRVKNPEEIYNDVPGKDYADPMHGAMLIIYGAQELIRRFGSLLV